ncbi:radical SAM protein [Candidatus Pacearchaeota archaeon]|nr:radical SAM protein [Candidatus Pacearchaeota archaeon]
MSQEQILVEKQKKKKKEPEKKQKKKSSVKGEVLSYLAKKIIYFPLLRNSLMKMLEKKMYEEVVTKATDYPKKVQEKKLDFIKAILQSGIRNFDKGYISKNYMNRAFDTLVKQSWIEKESLNDVRDKFEKINSLQPPSFIVFSPTQVCNLKCTGCYASSSEMNATTLPYDVVEKVVDETYNEWGSRFMVISGGEPLLYKDDNKTLFDIWEKYDQMFFLFFTNGTRIDEKTAKRFAGMGNVTPAISVEGFEKETDERRGPGTYKKILEAAKNLREAGAPFGVSVTITKKNYEILKEDKFYDFIFNELGASYMWMFQLMPIGQATCVKELMIDAKQRVDLFRHWEKLISEKNYPVADFWNSGVLADGCIAYGRPGGYLYIDWHGNITPCAFVPFYEDNVKDLFANNKKLADALHSDLFKNGRKWQQDFGLSHTNKPGNWLMACSIRDNWKNFKKNILTDTATPEDPAAKEFINSSEIDKVLSDFNEDLDKLTTPIWENEYLDKDTNEEEVEVKKE